MFFVSKKRIDMLEKRIRQLETLVSDLKEDTKIEVLPADIWWFDSLPTVSVKKIVEAIITHLGMKIVYKRAEKEGFLLQEKK